MTGVGERTRLGSGAWLAAVLLLVPAAAGAARFEAAGVWAGRPAEASYTPRAHEAFNNAGGPVQIRRTGRGSYGVFFGALEPENAAVQVSAAGPHGDRCQVTLRRRTRGGTELIVACRNAAGRPVDSAFSLLLVAQDGGDAPLGHALADRRSEASYSAAAGKGFNSAGGAPTITRSGTGRYAVAFPGLSAGGGNVQVAAEGLLPAHCKVAGWGSGTANVACFDDAGRAADSIFSVLMTGAESLGGTASFVWGSQATSARYDGAGGYGRNAAGGRIPIERRAEGTYEVVFERVEGLGGVPVVTGYGRDAVECNLGGLAPESGGARVSVHCFGADGAPQDGRFSLLLVKPVPKGSAPGGGSAGGGSGPGTIASI